MQNPLRRPRGNSGPQRRHNHDVERNGPRRGGGDDAVMSQGARGHFVAMMLGGMVAAALVSCMFPGSATFQTKLTGDTSIAQGLFIEMFLTAELILTVLFLAAEKSKATFLAPVAIGLALFVSELAGVYYTGGSLNPARSFGPDVVNRQFDGYHWIYWLGPFLGAAIAAGYYHFAKWNRYEEANPGQDAISDNEAASAKSG
ncbi:MAG: hypothetical protein Q9208_002479 [Pyrenodesmia sp. 3 TL-2023]